MGTIVPSSFSQFVYLAYGVAIRLVSETLSICEFKFDQQMSSGAKAQAKVLQFEAFGDHGWGHVALYPR